MAFWQWSKTAALNTDADPTINWSEGMSPSSVDDSARAVMARAAEYRDDQAGSLITGGTATAYTLATNQGFGSLANLSGQTVTFQVHATSGAAPTLDVDGRGAKAIKSVSGTTLPTGAMISGGIYSATYSNSNNEWVLHGFVAFQPLDATLTALAGLTTAADKGIYFTAPDAAATFDLTPAGRAFLDDLDASAQRSTLGLGSAAVKNTGVAGDAVPLLNGNNTFSGTMAATAATGIAAKNTAKAAVYFLTDGAANITIQGSAFNVASVAIQTVAGQNGFRVTFTNALAGNYIIAANASEGATVQNFTVNAVTRNTTTFDFFVTKAGAGVVRNNLIVDLIFFEIT